VAENRFDTDPKAKNYVWSRAAGHCELCSLDLTQDLMTLTPTKLGEVAHIIPASPKGPRSDVNQTADVSEELTNDPDNLMLLCPTCHNTIDKTPDGYPIEDLTDAHLAFIDGIEFAANVKKYNVAAGVIILGQHFQTNNSINPSELQAAMWRDQYRLLSKPVKILLPEIDGYGRDERYYENVKTKFKEAYQREVTHYQSEVGDKPVIGIVGLADIPSLMICGQKFGDRVRHEIYSNDRNTRLKWPDKTVAVPDFTFTFSGAKDRVNALVLSISADIPERDVLAALPGCEIATFRAPIPNYHIIRNAAFIEQFGVQLQIALSQLEAASAQPIHVFPAIPAAMAIKFGSLLSTNHRHRYAIYDRDSAGGGFNFHTYLN
jgi:hypothetical protein